VQFIGELERFLGGIRPMLELASEFRAEETMSHKLSDSFHRERFFPPLSTKESGKDVFADKMG